MLMEKEEPVSLTSLRANFLVNQIEDKIEWSVLDILNHSHRKIWYSKILENI